MEHKKQIIKLLLGAVAARAIYAAAEFGIADLIKEGIKDSSEIAKRLGAHPQSLYRLLRLLASHDFFREEEKNMFVLTPLGECLTTDHPDSLRDFIRREDETRWRSLGKLRSTVEKGVPAFEQIYGKNYFEYLAGDSKMNTRFELGMSNLTEEENTQIAKVLPIEDAKTIVDIGGGRGGFISAILNEYSSLQGILFELPHVLFPKENLLIKGVEQRCDIVSGSFFEQLPKEGELYTLKRVLHDWDDHSVQIILRNCAKAIHTGGKILVIEAIIPEGNGKSLIKDADVYMMTLFPGRERTEKEFRSLFDSSGLQLTSIIPTETELSILEAIPK